MFKGGRLKAKVVGRWMVDGRRSPGVRCALDDRRTSRHPWIHGSAVRKRKEKKNKTCP